MKFEVIKEVSNNDGKKETWYLVEPKNPIDKFFHRLTALDYSPHQDIEDAKREAYLKSKGRWDNTISRSKT